MIYVNFTFSLQNGKKRVIKVSDVKENITDTELLALADLFIEKNSQSQGSSFVSLEKCEKYTVELEVIR